MADIRMRLNKHIVANAYVTGDEAAYAYNCPFAYNCRIRNVYAWMNNSCEFNVILLQSVEDGFSESGFTNGYCHF